MGADSKIAWTHHTFNPWRGCSKVHTGCTHCYAEALSTRQPDVFGVWGDNGTRVVASEAMWRQPLKWNRDAAAAGERHRVFCASLADVFEDRPDLTEPRERLLELIGATRNLDWLLLTKRPQNVNNLMSPAPTAAVPIPYLGGGDYLPNVWLGTSISNQETADDLVPKLLAAQASLRFLSVEPLIGPVNLAAALFTQPPPADCEHDEGPESGGLWNGPTALGQRGVQWVIVGGESGWKARPCEVAWIESVVRQCAEAGVPCFVKQMGSRSGARDVWDLSDSVFRDLEAAGADRFPCVVRLDDKGGRLDQIPEDLRVRQFPVTR